MRRILEDSEWRTAVQDEALKAWDEFQSEVPSELQAAHDQLREIDRKISNLIDQIEEANAPVDVKERLESRREVKERLLRQIETLQRQVSQKPRTLTAEQIDEALKNLDSVLSNGTPAAAIALGNLIGDVVVCQVSRPGRKRPFFQGEFVLRTRSVVNAVNGTDRSEPSDGPAGQDAAGERIAIDFVEPDRKDIQSDEVKQLSDQGLCHWEIADGSASTRVA